MFPKCLIGVFCLLLSSSCFAQRVPANLSYDPVTGTFHATVNGVDTVVSGPGAGVTTTTRNGQVSDSITSADCGNTIIFASNSNATIPAYGTSGMKNCRILVLTTGASGAVNITPSAGTVNTASSQFINVGQSCTLAGDASGTNWVCNVATGPELPGQATTDIFGNLAIGGLDPYIDVTEKFYGAKCDGASDDTASINLAIDAVNASTTIHTIWFPGDCKVTAGLHEIKVRGVKFVGCRGDRPGNTQGGGCAIDYYGSTASGTSPLATSIAVIQIGEQKQSALANTSSCSGGACTLNTTPLVQYVQGQWAVNGKINITGTGTCMDGGPYSLSAANNSTGVLAATIAGCTTTITTGEVVSVYNDGSFDGIQGFEMDNLELRCSVPNTALPGGFNQYCSGVTGIQHWRAGDLILNHVQIEEFEFGVWTNEGQVDRFTNVTALYNLTAFMMGPRSDQLNVTNAYTLYNGHAFWFNGARGARIRGWQSVDEGGGTSAPATHALVVGSLYNTTPGDPNNETGGSGDIQVDFPWWEHSGQTVSNDAFCEFGSHDLTADTNPNTTVGYNTGLTINQPLYFVRQSTDTTAYLCTIGHADHLVITAPQDGDVTSSSVLTSFLSYIGTDSPTDVVLNLFGQGDFTHVHTAFTNNGSGTPVPIVTINGGAATLKWLPVSTTTDTNKLVKYTGAPSALVRAATTDVSGIVGVVQSAGNFSGNTSGYAAVQSIGLAWLVMDGATTAGDYVIISPSAAGNGRDIGSTCPTAGQIIGRVLSTNGSTSTDQIDLYPPDFRCADGVLSGTATGSTTLLAANSCGDTVTGSVTGAATTMGVVASPQSTVTSGLTWNSWVSSSNTVSVTYCNVTGGGITPGAITFNLRVLQ